MPESTNTIRFVTLTLLFVLAWNFTSSLVHRGWITAAVITFAMLCAYVRYVWLHRDAVLGRILLFGLATGWSELLADRWLVDTTATLVYLPGGPFVMRSPLYMPFAWMIVTTQLGYLAWWMTKRWGVAAASLMIALLGAVNIPLYEQWANSAGWWYYRNTPMLGNTPWYIIGGEFLIALSLPAAVSFLGKRHWIVSIGAGICQGLWIWLSYYIVFSLVSRVG